tara:strand:+ start:261 stop:770 length:510 start_codon:yes stop_codon:yes gene_type:complete
MGCNRCGECGQKYEQSSAEEYFWPKYELRSTYGPDSDGEYPDEYDHCPDCDEKQQKTKGKDGELKQALARVAELEAALKRATKAPPVKKQKTETVLPKVVWHVTKADHPMDPQDKLASCEVIGTYLSKAKAEQAMADYLEEGGWQEGYGYHQGEDAESNIGVVQSFLIE